MLHLLGVNLPDQKLVQYALPLFYGIGQKTSLKVLASLSIHKSCKIADLSEPQVNQLSSLLSDMKIESDLRKEIRANIMHHRSIGSYVGRRHAMGLPVRGQNTRNNAKTARRLNGRWLKSEKREYSSSTRSAIPAPDSPFASFFNRSWF
ncbi:small subunit ribosomal protein S13 [Entomortierella parvispora]|uniref:Small ribosomal subunit protein uS13m n=1 Tax=Entomortierella parvispora TaxID=205924 RepID=A0A9P3LY75_9FUNG|nr:small subunit ribosomal protein S13 [Entomortierella parvispora]